MNINTMTYCDGESAFPIHNGDETLDAGDILKFVIHDNSGTTLGNMFGGQGDVNTAYGIFPGMTNGTTYYISAIAGMDDGTGKVDLNDPELSVAQGTPVIFLAALIADPGTPGELTCTNSQVTLGGQGSSTGGNYAYSWTGPSGFNSAVQFPIVTEAGTYCFLIVDLDNSCISSTECVTVNGDVTAPIAVASVSNFIDCVNTTAVLSSIGSSTGANITYSWSIFGNEIGNTQEITVSFGGFYILVVTDVANGCTETVGVDVVEDINPPFVQIQSGGDLDCNNTSTILDGSGFGGQNLTYIWNTGETSATIVVSSPGNYTLTVFDNLSGCFSTDVITVSSNISIPIADAGPDMVLDCMNQTATLDGPCNASQMNIVGNVIPTGTGFTYLWTTTDGVINSGTTTVSPTIGSAGTYVLEIDDPNNGCVGYDEIVIYDFNDLLTVDEEMNLNCNPSIANELDASILLSNLNLSYTWTTVDGNFTSANDILNPTIDMEGTYNLLVTDNLTGCTTTASITMGPAIFPEAVIEV